MQNVQPAESTAFPIKRRWPRFAVTIPVRISTDGPTRSSAWEGQGTDLNGGGLAVKAEIELAIGEQISVELTPPFSGQALTFRCFVRNRDGNRYGVELITENDEDYVKAGLLHQKLALLQSDASPS
jgi:hypothetical protein